MDPQWWNPIINLLALPHTVELFYRIILEFIKVLYCKNIPFCCEGFMLKKKWYKEHVKDERSSVVGNQRIKSPFYNSRSYFHCHKWCQALAQPQEDCAGSNFSRYTSSTQKSIADFIPTQNCALGATTLHLMRFHEIQDVSTYLSRNDETLGLLS